MQVQVKEREPGAFLVQWRVPKVLPPRALPSPVLPDGCVPEGERVLVDQAGGWLCRQVWRCPDGLAGRTLGIRFPFHNPSLSTVFRVELLSGERFAHALGPLDDSWRVPDADVGAFERWLESARSAVVSGGRHVAGDWVHLAFLLALVLLGGALGSLRLVTAFAVGQLAAVGTTALLGRGFEPLAAELCLAVAVVFLAREALRPTPDGRRLAGLAGGAGLFHGLALAALSPEESGPEGLVALVLGMDAALLVLAAALAAFGRLAGSRQRRARLRPLVAYAVGGTAVAAALVLATRPPVAAEAERTDARLPGLAGAPDAGLAGSRRVAPAAAAAPIQSFLTVEPFEVRHEVLVRLSEVAEQVGLALESADFVELDAQEQLARRVAELVAARTAVEVDGRPSEGVLDRVGFMTADATGVLPRQELVREPVGEALVGVTLVHPAAGMPGTVALRWQAAGVADRGVPVTVIDPETSRATILTAERPACTWENELLQDPLPTLTAVAVEPRRLSVPLVSLALLVAALALLVVGLRGRRRAPLLAAARVALALVLLAAPLARISIALPASFGGAVTAGQARRVLAGLLPNVYRAFELRDEALAYDRLAVAVTGETLTEVYLEHRRALEVEERGGARARVDAVEVLEVGALEAREDGGFDADAAWIVGGTVTHFGHRHFRQNRYDTRVAVVPVDGTWKIRSIEVLELERVR